MRRAGPVRTTFTGPASSGGRGGPPLHLPWGSEKGWAGGFTPALWWAAGAWRLLGTLGDAAGSEAACRLFWHLSVQATQKMKIRNQIGGPKFEKQITPFTRALNPVRGKCLTLQ